MITKGTILNLESADATFLHSILSSAKKKFLVNDLIEAGTD